MSSVQTIATNDTAMCIRRLTRAYRYASKSENDTTLPMMPDAKTFFTFFSKKNIIKHTALVESQLLIVHIQYFPYLLIRYYL